jgi:double zinc ribbon protein
MLSNRCSFCDHGNPADSKFCGACGGALHLAPCQHCGAVNEVTANYCHQCLASPRGGGTDTSDAFPPAANEASSASVVDLLRRLAAGGDFPPATQVASRPETEAPTQRAPAISHPRAADIPSRLAARTAVSRTADAPTAPASEGPRAPAKAAPTAPATEIPPAPVAEVAGKSSSVPPAATASSPSSRQYSRIIVGTAAAVVLAAITVLGYYYRERSPGEATEPPAVSSEDATKRPSKAIGKAGDRAPSRPEGCTEAAAALGLCALKPVQKKEAGTNPALQTCTEATVALGLCAPKPTQKKE